MRVKDSAIARLNNLTNDMQQASLGRVMDMFAAGQITTQQAREYCEVWNTSTYRFTEALVVGNDIEGYWIVQRPLRGEGQ